MTEASIHTNADGTLKTGTRVVDIQWLGDFNETRKRTHGKIDDALGYLAAWAMGAYGHVSIMVTATDCEASAYYKRDKDSPDKGGLLMVAVWRESQQEYSFHT